MDWLYYIVIPIVSALIGGAFSFVCILITIKHENKHFKIERQEWETERKEREIERLKQEWEKNKIKNDEIIKNRPQFIVVDKACQPKKSMTVKLLPYLNYEIVGLTDDIVNRDLLVFDYPHEIYDDDFWDSYSVTIKNIGCDCVGGFLHLPDKSGVNIYDEYDFNERNYILVNFYCERVGIPTILSGETLTLKICYPKSKLGYKDISLDIFMYDHFENEWRQDNINHKCNFNDSYTISGEEYGMNFREEITQWRVIDRLYFYNVNHHINMPIDYTRACAFLAKKKDECNLKEHEFDKYRRDVKDGKILLKS